MTRSLILDSYALLAFFQNEPGADSVREMILSAVEDKVSLAMCVINLGEVWYSIARKNSVEIADVYLLNIQGMPIEIVDADWELTKQAAFHKTNGNLSCADCFVAALAKLRKGEVVTGDKEFAVLKDEVKITWLK